MFSKPTITCRTMVAKASLRLKSNPNTSGAPNSPANPGPASARLYSGYPRIPLSEGLIGRLSQIPSSFNSTESLIYDKAVKNFPSIPKKNREETREKVLPKNADEISPLFGTIPAYKAVLLFMESHLGLDATALELHEHYFQQLSCPLPVRSEIKTIVELADIVDKGTDAMFVIDASTYDDKYNCLVFNQFCFLIPDARAVAGCGNGRRLVRSRFNPFSDISPNLFYKLRISAAQDSVISNLVSNHTPHPLKPLPPSDLVDDEEEDEDEENEEENLLQPLQISNIKSSAQQKKEHRKELAKMHKHDFQHSPLSYLTSVGTVADSVITNMHIPYPRLKGIKVIRGPKPVLPDDDLEVCAWKFKFDQVSDKIIFFHSFNLTPARFDMVHYGHISLY